MYAEIQSIIWILIVSYLVGSIPTALWVGYARTGRDIRKTGSGNAGATNAGRLMGPTAAVLVFLVDAMKGAVAILAAMSWTDWAWSVPLSAVCVLLGHCYPVLAGFRGGKGASTAWGVLLVVNWPLAVFAVLCFGGVLVVKRVSSLATLSTALLMGVAAAVGFLVGWLPVPEVVTVGSCGAFLWFTHRDNLKRLVRGEEAPVV